MIKTQLTEKQFANLTLTLLFRKTIVKIFAGIIILGLVINAFIPKKGYEQKSVVEMILPLTILVAFPFIISLSAKKNFANNPLLGAPCEYQFEEERIIIKSENVETKTSWSKIYEVSRNNNWILIWLSSNVANAISKNELSESAIGEIKSILIRNGVKNNL